MVGAGNDDHDLAVVIAGARPAVAPAPIDRGGEGPGRRAAGAALDDREHPRAPVALLGRLRVGARDHDARTLFEVRAQLVTARDDVLPVGDLAVEEVAQEAGDGGLAGALGRARALDLEPDQRADVAHERAPPLLYHKRLADVLNDRTVESGLALGDRRARLTAHYAPVA